MPRDPKLERPKVDVGLSVEEWSLFVRHREVFCPGSNIDDVSVPSQLFQCAGPTLGNSPFKANSNATLEPLRSLLSPVRLLAVILVATCVLRIELLQLHQERDEALRAFTARVRGKAETCAFSAVCECGETMDYIDHIFREALLKGIYDLNIHREVLGTTDSLQKSVTDVTALVENKEMVRNVLPFSARTAMSSFLRIKRAQPALATIPPPADQAKKAPCPIL